MEACKILFGQDAKKKFNEYFKEKKELKFPWSQPMDSWRTFALKPPDAIRLPPCSGGRCHAVR